MAKVQLTMSQARSLLTALGYGRIVTSCRSKMSFKLNKLGIIFDETDQRAELWSDEQRRLFQDICKVSLCSRVSVILVDDKLSPTATPVQV